MREHANDLIGCLSVEESAAVDENAAAVRYESIERAVVDDNDLDVLLTETGNAQDRLGVILEQLLDFRVADDRRSGPRLSLRAEQDACRHKRDHACCWRWLARPASCAGTNHVAGLRIAARNLVVASRVSMWPGSRLIAGFQVAGTVPEMRRQRGGNNALRKGDMQCWI